MATIEQNDVIPAFPSLQDSLIGMPLIQEIGALIDPMDMMHYLRLSQHALENTTDQTTSEWQNPTTGHSGTITPLETLKSSLSQYSYCRHYSQSFQLDDISKESKNTACRNLSGTWKIITN